MLGIGFIFIKIYFFIDQFVRGLNNDQTKHKLRFENIRKAFLNNW